VALEFTFRVGVGITLLVAVLTFRESAEGTQALRKIRRESTAT
jgi:hypothetical protein